MNLRRSVIEARLGDVRNAVFNDFEVGEADLSLAPRVSHNHSWKGRSASA